MKEEIIARTIRSKENGVTIIKSGGKTLTFHVIWIGNGKCKIRFEQNQDFSVYRKELYEKIKHQKNKVDD